MIPPMPKEYFKSPSLIELLTELKEYMDNKADADLRDQKYVPNTEMRFSVEIEKHLQPQAAPKGDVKSKEGFDLQKFSELSMQRNVEGFKCDERFPITFFTTGLAGEVGELCNMIKKTDRVRLGSIDGGTSYKAKDITKQKLAEEIGGIFIYLDLIASLLCIDMETAIVETFNSKSEELNLPHRYQYSQFKAQAEPTFTLNDKETK